MSGDPATPVGEDATDGRDEQLRALLWEGFGAARPFLLLDGSCDPSIHVHADAFPEPARCLFDGEAGEDLAEVAPWLVEAERHGPALDWFLEEGFGKGWGVFVLSALPLVRLKARLKAHLRVESERDGRYLFKFYRPRALLGIVPALTPEQRLRFFRDVDAFVTEHGDGVRILRVGNEGALLAEDHPLTAREGGA